MNKKISLIAILLCIPLLLSACLLNNPDLDTNLFNNPDPGTKRYLERKYNTKFITQSLRDNEVGCSYYYRPTNEPDALFWTGYYKQDGKKVYEDTYMRWVLADDFNEYARQISGDVFQSQEHKIFITDITNLEKMDLTPESSIQDFFDEALARKRSQYMGILIAVQPDDSFTIEDYYQNVEQITQEWLKENEKYDIHYHIEICAVDEDCYSQFNKYVVNDNPSLAQTSITQVVSPALADCNSTRWSPDHKRLYYYTKIDINNGEVRDSTPIKYRPPEYY